MQTMSEQEKRNIEQQRLADFKKVLAYHLTSKIRYHFKGNVELFYSVPKIWCLFRQHKLGKEINPFELVAKFNNAGLDKYQVRSIFGKYPNDKSFNMPCRQLIEQDGTIKIREHGHLMVGKEQTKRRIGICNCYLLPFDEIKAIFNDKELLKKVLDAGSDYYTDRQRRLIFTQINKQKNYHYKTNQELTEEERIAAVIADFDI